MAAYGRLDVYSPEGPIDSYALEKPSISVGRQPGNDIVLDTAGISRYHFVLELRGERAFLIDKESQNGTYIDGVKVAADEPHLLQEGEEIQVGDVRIVFHSNAQADIPTSEAQRLDAERKTFRVEVEDTVLSVTPGAHTQTILKIFNIGEDADTYEVSIDGIPKEWTRLDRVAVELAPGGSTSVVFSLKPLRRPDSKPGNYEVHAHVASQGHPGAEIEVPFSVHVLSYSGFGMVMAVAKITGDQRFELYTQNQGSGPLPVQFMGQDKEQRLEFDINPSSVTLTAGEKRTIRGTVHMKQPRLLGKPEEIHFAVVAHARDASGFQVPVPAIFIDQPRLPAWLPLLVAGGVLGVLVILLGIGLVLPALTRTATPTAPSTPTRAPSVTPVQIVVPTFTPPPSETPSITPTFTPSPTPTLSETEIAATRDTSGTIAAAQTAQASTATSGALQTYAAQQTLTAELTRAVQSTQQPVLPGQSAAAGDGSPTALPTPTATP